MLSSGDISVLGVVGVFGCGGEVRPYLDPSSTWGLYLSFIFWFVKSYLIWGRLGLEVLIAVHFAKYTVGSRV